jgi:hypothetical protein
MMSGTVAKYWVFCAFLAASFGVSGILAISAQAKDLNCRDRTAARSPACAQARSDAGASTRELAAQRRPRITIYPRHRYLGPNAKRYCQFWLAKEYRVSGTVITPQQRCWWN